MKSHNLTKGYTKDKPDLLGLSLKVKDFLEGGDASPKTMLDYMKHTEDHRLFGHSVQIHVGSAALSLRLGIRRRPDSL